MSNWVAPKNNPIPRLTHRSSPQIPKRKWQEYPQTTLENTSQSWLMMCSLGNVLHLPLKFGQRQFLCTAVDDHLRPLPNWGHFIVQPYPGVNIDKNRSQHNIDSLSLYIYKCIYIFTHGKSWQKLKVQMTTCQLHVGDDQPIWLPTGSPLNRSP
jgi:hypothetical protein